MMKSYSFLMLFLVLTADISATQFALRPRLQQTSQSNAIKKQCPTPVQSNLPSLQLPAYYLAMVSLTASEPSEEEYNKMMEASTKYLSEFFQRSSFPIVDHLENGLLETFYGLGKPEERYNIYMSFCTNIVFAAGSTPPGISEIYEALDFGTEDFILEYVNEVAAGSPFETVLELYYETL